MTQSSSAVQETTISRKEAAAQFGEITHKVIVNRKVAKSEFAEGLGLNGHEIHNVISGRAHRVSTGKLEAVAVEVGKHLDQLMADHITGLVKVIKS